MKEIPVLLYHNIGHYPEDAMEDGLQPEPLKRQMSYLSENGYNVVSLSWALDHLAGRIKLPPKSIAITGTPAAIDSAITKPNRSGMRLR